MPLKTPVTVFVSSTCYDLLDVRQELYVDLEKNGFLVKLSDAPDSAFQVDPTTDSITSCLSNVASSDVVVCLIDKRYGGVPKDGPYKGISPTEVEVNHARELKKPVFLFIRDKALQEFDLMKSHGWTVVTHWVEPNTGTVTNPKRQQWFTFVEKVSVLPKTRRVVELVRSIQDE